MKVITHGAFKHHKNNISNANVAQTKRELSKTESNQNNQVFFTGADHYHLSLHPSKISFKGIKRKLSDVPLASPSAMADMVKQTGKQPVIISDFDGTLVPFGEDPNKVITKEEAEHFKNNTLSKLNKAKTPLFLLTAGSLERFALDTMFGKKTAEQLSAIGLKGNSMNLTVPDKKAENFINKWTAEKNAHVVGEQQNANNPAYTIEKTSLDNGQTKIKLRPADLLGFSPEQSDFDTKLRKNLEPLGFRIENLGMIVNLHWRGLSNKCEDTQGLVKIQLNNENDRLFNEIKNTPKESKADSSEEKKVEISNSKNDKLNLSFEELLEFGKHKFKAISEDHLGDKLIKKEQLNDLSNEDIYKNGKAIIVEHNANKAWELSDVKTQTYNKGEAVKQLMELFGGKDNNFPIYLGDAVGQEKGVLKDDEFAMKETSKMGGIGIAVMHRDSKEIAANPASRSSIDTEADYKLDSFNNTIPFIENLAQEFIPVKR